MITYINKNYFRKKLFIAGFILTTSLTSVSCKKVDCDIEPTHVHKYIDDEGFSKYLYNEYDKLFGYYRLDEYKVIEDADLYYYKYLSSKDLTKISDNIDVLKNYQEEYPKYNHYEYYYSYNEPVTRFDSDGNVVVDIRSVNGWTIDKRHTGITNKKRLVEYHFMSYAIEKKGNHKYKVLKNEISDDIVSTMIEYPYIKDHGVVKVIGNRISINVESIEELKEMKEEYPDIFEINDKESQFVLYK